MILMMKGAWFFISLVIASVGATGQKPTDNSHYIVTNPQDVQVPYIFRNGDAGYSCFRIPAIVLTKSGTLLAFAEGRKRGCSDTGDIDLVLKRSHDGGKTWSKVTVVWDDTTNTCGNPAPVIDWQ